MPRPLLILALVFLAACDDGNRDDEPPDTLPDRAPANEPRAAGVAVPAKPAAAIPEAALAAAPDITAGQIRAGA